MTAFAAPFPVPALSDDHPQWLGGACLPDLLAGEEEVARLEVATATRDVVSVRERRRAGRVHYRVVDEYGGAYEFAPRTARRPLARAELRALVASIRRRGTPHALLHAEREPGSSPLTWRQSAGVEASVTVHVRFKHRGCSACR